MNSVDSNLVERLFREIAAVPAEQRAAWLDRQCAGHAAVRAEIESMLAVLGGAKALMAGSQSADRLAPATHRSREGPGMRIGPYKLLQSIGEGGFGSVFMAEQEKPVVRRVALKIIKLGMDTRQVIARFEAERQALAMMDHPNIARVLDAGATETGRPYFVMELVSGEPITAYCDKNHLTVPERLELFGQVCLAVQHAHQKGIIHRDIKPSNVLVSTQDGRPHAKVIDFGIAKATAARLTEKTLFTEHKSLVGTPEHMSPEQAGGGPDIDTRTDVYSLGVLLYELLTGTTPFDSQSLRTAAYAEIQRVILEDEPPKPSTRVGSGVRTAEEGSVGPPEEQRDRSKSGFYRTGIASIAAQRRIEPRRLVTLIRGELDWIVMKALEKDRARRYETASGLAMDVRRYLTGETVLAAPPSAAYRIRKFVRRHRGVVTAGALVTAALVLGLAGTWIGMVHARTARALAERRQKETQQVADFQAKMLADIDANDAGRRLMQDVRDRFAAALAKEGVAEAERARQADTLAAQLSKVNATDAAAAMIDRTILRPALRAVDAEFKDQPVVDAALRQTLGNLYLSLGLYEAARPLHERALQIRRRVLGEEHPETLDSINSMSTVYWAQGKLAEAEPYAREALEKDRRVLGPEHRETLGAIANFGVLLLDQGKTAEAEPYYREAMDKARRVLGEDHPDTMLWIANMADLLREQGKYGEAEPLAREALEKRRRVQGDDHPETMTALDNLARLLETEGKLAEAEPYYREALEKRRRALGEEHPGTLASINNMGAILQDSGKPAEAERYFREALEKQRRVLGREHYETLGTLNNLGAVLRDEGRIAEAEACFREGVETARRVVGPEHRTTLNLMGNLGSLLLAQGRLSDAEPYIRDALETRRRVFGAEHPGTLQAISSMGALLEAQGKLVEAEAILVPAWTVADAKLPPGHRTRKALLASVVTLYELRDKAEPGKGFGVQAASWREKLARHTATTQPAPGTTTISHSQAASK